MIIVYWCIVCPKTVAEPSQKIHRNNLSRAVLACCYNQNNEGDQMNVVRENFYPESIQVTGELALLGDIKLVLSVSSYSQEFQYWRTMVEKFHYLESSSLFGKQIKYLIHSSTLGYIGALAFSSASWKLEARDAFIGWSEEERVANLDSVVCNSRFLILPWIKVNNLASHILSLSIKELPKDWQDRYGYSPALIETFVDSEKFLGTCYKASNWTHIGITKGRGRNDRENKHELSKKDIYVYALRKDFFRCEIPQKQMDWIEREFQYVDLPNLSRKKRLLSIAGAFFAQPTENLVRLPGFLPFAGHIFVGFGHGGVGVNSA